jgi:hypothetical protein
MSAPMLPLLQLAPAELATVPLLHDFAAKHPGVRIITPHYHEEPWRADIAAGAVPGDGSARVVGADWPSGLLVMLHRAFGTQGHSPP